MDKIIDYCQSKLYEHFITEDISEKVKEIYSTLPKNNLEKCYKLLLQSLKSNKMYSNILKNRTVFDMNLFLPNRKFFYDTKKMKDNLKKKLGIKYVYFGDKFIGIKVNDKAYETKGKLLKESVPYKKLYRSIRSATEFFEIKHKEIVFHMGHKETYYNDFVNIAQKINLPIRIVDFQFMNPLTISAYQEIDLVLEEREWPKDDNAIRYGKTAFYCYFQSKSNSNTLISKDHLVYKLNNKNFVFKIKEESSKNLEEQFNKLIEGKPDWWVYNVKYIKTFLSYFGFYPFYFHDLLVEILCYKIKEFYAPSFLKQFLSLNFDFNFTFDLETNEYEESEKNTFIRHKNALLPISTPCKVVTDRLKSLGCQMRKSAFSVIDDRYKLITTNYIVPNIKDYDFVLSNKPRNDFTKLDFEGTFSFYELKELSKLVYIFYSEKHNLIMVKDKGIGIDMLIGLIIVKSGYNHLYRNKK
ncbi:hypothetical protein H312_01046 [Anncaliia algerae PRA339]|uniref:Uncharacterized protein n=1 Tax=Anncaliia algerae PRA339 TaxID=1288291 RepID=A0A059F394_9MICR|nr:hypothetical protein H312_01046 [Anncaliia algerae PRA339]